MTVNKEMERCFTPFVISEMRITTTRRYHYPPTSMAESYRVLADWQGAGAVVYGWWECATAEAAWKPGGQLLKKWNTHFPHDPAPRLLDADSRRGNTCSEKDVSMDACSCFSVVVQITGSWTDKQIVAQPPPSNKSRDEWYARQHGCILK